MTNKAYARPGTSEGFEKTRNIKFFTLSDIEKARKLPKYDWPEKLVYQTPASHRIFTKQSVPEEDEKLVTKDDNHYVFVRPKSVVGSSGSVWARETVKLLRQMEPDVFEIRTEVNNYSIDFRKACAILHDSTFM